MSANDPGPGSGGAGAGGAGAGPEGDPGPAVATEEELAAVLAALGRRPEGAGTGPRTAEVPPSLAAWRRSRLTALGQLGARSPRP